MKRTFTKIGALASMLIGAMSAHSQTICVTDQIVSPATMGFFCNGQSQVGLPVTEIGKNYYLLDANGNIIGKKETGTGSTIVLPTGNQTSSTTLSVYAATPTTAMQVNGVNQWATNSSPVGLPTGSLITVEAWVYPISYPDGTYNGILSYGLRTCTGNSFVLSMDNNGRPTMATWCNDFLATDGPVADLNQWNHIACVVDCQNVRLYLNGYEWAGTLPVMPNIVSGALNIGATDFSGRIFNGKIDDVRIWNVARTADEIRENRLRCLPGSTPGLVSSYQFEEGSGSTTFDLTGANNLTMVNAPLWVSGSDVCSACADTMSQEVTVSIDPLLMAGVSPSTQTICPGTDASISIDASQDFVNYVLKNSSNVVVDGPYTGDGNPITFNTGILTSGDVFSIEGERISYGLDFDGVDDYVEIQNKLVSRNFTLEAFVKTSSPSLTGTFAYQGSPVFAADVSGSAYDFSFSILNNHLSFFEGGNNVQLEGTTNVTDGQWHHLAVIRSNNSITLYVDGALEASSNSGSLSVLSAPPTIQIGGSTVNSLYLNGSIDEVRIWQRALSLGELTAGMSTCYTGHENGLLEYYTFQDGPNSTLVSDLTLPLNLGVLHNMDVATDWVEAYYPCNNCLVNFVDNATVVVEDTEAPVISGCPANMTVTPNNVFCSAFVNWNAPVALDNCSSSLTLTNSHNPGDVFLVGTSTVSYSFEDAEGNIATCQFDVTVVNPIAYTVLATDEMMGNDGSIDLTFTSGAPPFTVTWSGPNSFSALSEDVSGLESGTYTVVIVDANGCQVNDTFTVGSQVGIDTNASELFSVYPNPSSGQFFVELTSMGVAQARIMDATGRIVYSGSLLQQRSTVDVSHLANGIYILSVEQNGQKNQMRILVQR